MRAQHKQGAKKRKKERDAFKCYLEHAKKKKGCCITRNSKRLKSHLNVCWRTGYMYHAVQINTPGDEENINMPKGYGRP